MLKKLFKPGKLGRWQIHEKDTIDEIIFRTTNVRNRLMLELMARGGMRVGEVLKLNATDVDDQNSESEILKAARYQRWFSSPKSWQTG